MSNATVHALVTGAASGVVQHASSRTHKVIVDEPLEFDGATDQGMNPFELLLSALGACTSMTVSLYARRKGWPLESVDVELSHDRAKMGEPKDHVVRKIRLVGDLTEEQRVRLLEIANKCPVHKTVTAGVDVASSLLE